MLDSAMQEKAEHVDFVVYICDSWFYLINFANMCFTLLTELDFQRLSQPSLTISLHHNWSFVTSHGITITFLSSNFNMFIKCHK